MIFRFILLLSIILNFCFAQNLHGKNISSACFFNNTFTSSKNQIDSSSNFDSFRRPSIFDMMYRRGVLEIMLNFSVDEMIENRKSDKEYPATLTFPTKNGGFQKWDLKVKARGVYRRYNCDEMPPIKLNFKKKDLKRRRLSKFDDFKLVTHCIEDEGWAAVLVLKEYLAYKYFNMMTKESFRVQLLLVNYVDSESGKIRKHLGILIEDFAELRDRIGAKKTKKIFGISNDLFNQLDQDYFQMMCMFQYMIGNTDWSIESLRNVKVAERDGKLIPIPYDFDFSGLVAAPYARINPDYGTKSIRDRVFLGIPESEYSMEKIRKKFKKKKRRMKRFTKNLRVLPEDQRQDALYFLDSFFENMEQLNYPQITPDSGKKNLPHDQN